MEKRWVSSENLKAILGGTGKRRATYSARQNRR